MEFTDIKNLIGFNETAMRVNKVRTMNASLHKKFRGIAAISFFGLAAIGAPIATAITVGSIIASGGYTTMEIERNVIKSNAIKHKLKKIAKKVKRACGINIRPEFNYNTRQAGFVLYDNMSGKIPITSFLNSDNISGYLSLEQCDIINKIIESEFAHINSYRGKGEEAKNAKEFRYREVNKIGLDNITCAFDDVGGVLTNKELMSLSSGTKISRIEYKRFMKEHKNEELWVFVSHLSDYLKRLSEIDTNEKEHILMEFEYYFKKYGAEGEKEYSNLWNQLRQEDELKRVM